MQTEKTRILFIEDEQNLLNSMAYILEREGFAVQKAASGEEGLRHVASFRPDLILLDLNLPGMDGFEVAEHLASTCPHHCPAIIVITGRQDEMDMVSGLEHFADDYVIKPVQPRVLIARIQSVLRRTEPGPAVISPDATPVHIDREAHVVRIEGQAIHLTKSEFGILDTLMRSPDKVFSREQIISMVKGFDCYVTDRTVDFQICRIRKKLGQYGTCIHTIRGIGYKFSSDAEPPC